MIDAPSDPTTDADAVIETPAAPDDAAAYPDDASSEPSPSSESRLEEALAARAARAVPRRRIKADQRGVMIAAVALACIGWVGLYIMLFPLNSVPLALYRWLFFILLYVATTGTALPFVWYLNNRFGGAALVLGGTILREGMWCGLFCIMLAWLQMIRALNGALAFFLALVFVVIEVFLRIRERQNLVGG
jgi:protein-S-isoprenylcysteine O-methyltransferase Ste14